MKLEVIDKAKDGSSAFGVKIIRRFSNDFGAGKILNRLSYSRPCITGRHFKSECSNEVRRVSGVA
jgi:hypothetical protein